MDHRTNQLIQKMMGKLTNNDIIGSFSLNLQFHDNWAGGFANEDHVMCLNY